MPPARRRQPAADVLGATMPEDRGRDSLDANIQRLLGPLRIRLSYHTHRSDRSERGFPDRVYVGASGLLFRELKSAAGVVRPEQREWLTGINATDGIDWDGLTEHPSGLLLPAAVWRPADWFSGRVERELRAIARPQAPGRAAATRRAPEVLKCGEPAEQVAARGHRCLTWGGENAAADPLPQ